MRKEDCKHFTYLSLCRSVGEEVDVRYWGQHTSHLLKKKKNLCVFTIASFPAMLIQCFHAISIRLGYTLYYVVLNHVCLSRNLHSICSICYMLLWTSIRSLIVCRLHFSYWQVHTVQRSIYLFFAFFTLSSHGPPPTSTSLLIDLFVLPVSFPHLHYNDCFASN